MRIIGAATSATQATDTAFRSARRPRARALLTAAALTGATLAAGGALAVPAVADTVLTQQVYNTGGQGLWLHPGSDTVASAVSDLMPDGTTFQITCWASGDDVNGDSIWDYGTDQATGDVGYAADYYINTPVTEGNEAAQLTALGLPQCGATDASSGQTANPQFDRSAAVSWALAHAQDPQTNGAECAKFVSEALWNGGLPQDGTWNDNGGYWSGITYFDGSQAANAVQPLIQYLQATYSTEWIPLGDMSNYNVPQAQPGDLIVYSWKNDGSLDHVAMVVGFSASNDQYPLVSEWGDVNWGLNNDIPAFNPTSYQDRGWTWSDMTNQWLSQEYPGTVAYLLHFNGGYTAPQF